MESITHKTQCRICHSEQLLPYLDLGRMPLANSYLDAETVAEEEISAPLGLMLCQSCGLSQLTHVVDPNLMYRHYLYVSSTPKTFRDHCDELAATAGDLLSEAANRHALDIASNDGCLLRSFKKQGFGTLGVDPAVNLAAEANANGVETICDYWSPQIAKRVLEEKGPMGIVTGTNVFAHVDDVHSFVQGIATVLDDSGICILEFPYLIDFIERNLFDTVYHEHLSYVSLGPVSRLLEEYGLQVIGIERFYDLHGGTIRIIGARTNRYPVAPEVEQTRDLEVRFGLTDPDAYLAFARRVETIKLDLMALIDDARADGRKIWGYGASAKGNTLLNYFGVNNEMIEFIIDDNPKKWGMFTPGTRIPICGIQNLQESDSGVDDLLLLAWNFADEIRRRCIEARYEGDFIYPVPVPKRVKGIS